MELSRFDISGPVLITPKVFEDGRGFFFESYNERVFAKHGLKVRFVQDNRSSSVKNVLRGIHFQRLPHAQDKLVCVTRGEALDIAVDLREGSPTYKRYVSVCLSESNKQMLFIPKGFGHGFLALSDIVDFEYKVSDFYDPDTDGGIRWNDPDINIDWEITDPLLSPKDAELPLLRDIAPVFTYEG
jgi:dTDP-4-dehydrorhamnose 3,5-epimerase